MAARLSAYNLRSVISELLPGYYKNYEIEQACTAFGMPEVENAWTYNSKRVYVSNRLGGVLLPEMIEISRRILAEHHDPELSQMLYGQGLHGVNGELHNLIFAAVGAKPRIVLRDAIDNVIDIVEGADRVLVYDRRLPDEGLTRGELLNWWAARAHDPGPERLTPSQTLGRRLARSLGSHAESVLFRTYVRRYTGRDDADGVPALIPQVYLHYDPYTAWELETMNGGELVRQRMDFLMLMSDRRRVVIEVDGQHHYANDPYTDQAKPSPRLYAEMVAEDRRIRLAGYEVHRFGAYELMQDHAEHAVNRFFDELLS
jgi:hypothetical protein